MVALRNKAMGKKHLFVYTTACHRRVFRHIYYSVRITTTETGHARFQHRHLKGCGSDIGRQGPPTPYIPSKYNPVAAAKK